jgi:uncharacterized protein (TIGR03086 family)
VPGQSTPAELSDQLNRAARNLLSYTSQDALGAVTREDPTPCAEFTVHDLCQHVLGSIRHSTDAAAKKPRSTEQVELTEAPWVAYPPAVEQLVAAWSEPEALEGETPFGIGVVPARLAAAVTIMELTVHGWDLATASGRTFSADADVVATATETAHQVAPQARPGGVFGVEQPAPAGADAVTRLIAFTGRSVG